MQRILVTGATGQLGKSFMSYLSSIHGTNNVYGLTRSTPHSSTNNGNTYLLGNITDWKQIDEHIQKYQISTIIHLAAILTTEAEKDPTLALNVNVNGLHTILELAAKHHVTVFWPSSIAALEGCPIKEQVPQIAAMNPATVYGMTKVMGEELISLYSRSFHVDVRSVRYPSIISPHLTKPGATAEFASAIFSEGIKNGFYQLPVSSTTALPFMYIGDAINAAVTLLQAPRTSLTVTRSYNISGFHSTAEELVQEIQKLIPIHVEYVPDERDTIAQSWPNSVDDTIAQHDWGWRPQYSLKETVQNMITNIQKMV